MNNKSISYIKLKMINLIKYLKEINNLKKNMNRNYL